MRIEDVIRTKGSTEVVTIAPDATVTDLVNLLAERNIGAVVVSVDGVHIDGIVSERDVVRGLAQHGGGIVDQTVRQLMTSEVYTVEPDSLLEDTAQSMTVHRIRHMPVLVNGQMVGLVSIGDVVKHRIDQLTDERDHLIGYLHS
nr:CBS domain-containing protein [Propionibacterium sp.]